MGTQKGIANLIRKKQAHYVLALKENHKRFYRKVNKLFDRADELNFNAMVYKKQIKRDYEHGRIEEREYTVLPMMYLNQYKKDWKDLSMFIRTWYFHEALATCSFYSIFSKSGGFMNFGAIAPEIIHL